MKSGDAVNTYILTYPLKTIYFSAARKKPRLVLDNFKLHVLYINNVEYQGLSEV